MGLGSKRTVTSIVPSLTLSPSLSVDSQQGPRPINCHMNEPGTTSSSSWALRRLELQLTLCSFMTLSQRPPANPHPESGAQLTLRNYELIHECCSELLSLVVMGVISYTAIGK